jgi:release factor glutamine methyltransferase
LAEAVLAAGVSVGEAVSLGRSALEAVGCDRPRLDAELLCAAALGVTRARLVLDRDCPLDPAAHDRLERLLARRARREPVAYILGHKDFRHISLLVDRRVLIPRPETELLVEVGLTLAAGAAVADVGTGSGAVALALKHERPDLSVTGIDLSAAALDVARSNALRLGLDLRLVQADLLDGADYDAVLANLPYVADGASLAPEIALYEPLSALFAGPDGLGAIRRLVARLSGPADADRVVGRGVGGESVVARGGRRISLLALEVGADQAAAVAALVCDAKFGSVEVLRDLAGHERVVVGRR